MGGRGAFWAPIKTFLCTVDLQDISFFRHDAKERVLLTGQIWRFSRRWNDLDCWEALNRIFRQSVVCRRRLERPQFREESEYFRSTTTRPTLSWLHYGENLFHSDRGWKVASRFIFWMALRSSIEHSILFNFDSFLSDLLFILLLSQSVRCLMANVIKNVHIVFGNPSLKEVRSLKC